MKRRASSVAQLGMGLWLIAVWAILWGSIAPGTLLAGAIVAAIVLLVFPMPPIDMAVRPHPIGIARLVGAFVLDLIRASWQVTRLALSRHRQPRQAVIAVQLRTTNELLMTLTAQLVSLVPGSLIVETRRRVGQIYVHVLDVGDVEHARAQVLLQEERVLRAFATREELDAAGFGKGRS